VDPLSGWTNELARAGVTIDVPSDPQANVEALLAAGEGPHVEFKRELPADAEQKRKHFKTVAAFATFDGGTMGFGMDPDEATVTGLVAVDKGSRDKPEFYIRRGSSTYPAQPGELREAARSRPPLADQVQRRRGLAV
jgi:hypothetical protein